MSVAHAPIHHNVSGFGRLCAIDFRDKDYMLKVPSLRTAAKERTSRQWRTGPILDQHNTPQCVGYSGEQFLCTGPVCNKPYGKPADLYRLAQSHDEWKGQRHEGSSVRGLFKALKELGYVTRYNWATDAKAVAAFLLLHGPVVFGTNWYEAMFTPDHQGFIWPTGTLVGGHAYLIKGVDINKRCPDGSKGALRLANSWGKGWGTNGLAWLSMSVAQRLLNELGEACTSDEVKAVAEPD